MLTFTFSSIFLAGWDGGGGASGSKLTRCPIPRRNALPPEFQPLLVLVSILKARYAQSSSGAPISSPRPLSPGDLAPPAPCSSSLCALSETDIRFLFIPPYPISPSIRFPNRQRLSDIFPSTLHLSSYLPIIPRNE